MKNMREMCRFVEAHACLSLLQWLPLTLQIETFLSGDTSRADRQGPGGFGYYKQRHHNTTGPRQDANERRAGSAVRNQSCINFGHGTGNTHYRA